MIQNFPFKQNQTNIDLQKIKSQISIILAEFERSDDLKDDVKTLFTSEFDNDDYNAMTSLIAYLNSIYQTTGDLKTAVKTLFTSGFTYDDLNAMTANKDFIKKYVKYLFNTGYTSTDITQMAALTNYMNSYLLISNLTYEVKQRFKSIYTNTDFGAMTNFNTYLSSIVPSIANSSPPVFLTFTQVGDENHLVPCNYLSYSTLPNYHYRVVWCYLTRTRGSDHFDHLYCFRSRNNTNDTGQPITTVFNFFPTSTMAPYVFYCGTLLTNPNGTLILRLLIGSKVLDINFSSTSVYTSHTVCYHIKLINANFDNIVSRLYPTTDNQAFPNVYAFDHDDLKSTIFFENTDRAYFEYDYLTESDYVIKTCYDVLSGQYSS